MALPTTPTDTVDSETGARVPSATTTATTREPTMNLSVYDHEKGCSVLNPELFERPMNAFHPDYVKTYMPEFLSNIRLESMQMANGVINGGKSKASRESKRGKTVNSINTFPKTKAKERVNLAPTEFHIYNKAGMPKGVK
jgi:hypothetical protein